MLVAADESWVREDVRSVLSGWPDLTVREVASGPEVLAAAREQLPDLAVLDLQMHHPDGYILSRPVGELDAFTVSQFRQTLAELASSPRLLIDMSAVPFLDSAGLGALIGGIRRARELGGDVAVACNRSTLVRLLRTTGFDRIVTVADSVEEAAAALRQPSQAT